MAFLSYSRADLLWVTDLARELRRNQISTWIDIENLLPGERWRDAMQRGLDHASIFVACVSRYSLESRWTGVEAMAAAERGIRILPVLLDDTDPAALPAEIGQWQACRLAAPSLALRTIEAAAEVRRSLGMQDLVRHPEEISPGRTLVVRIHGDTGLPSSADAPGTVTITGRLGPGQIAEFVDRVCRVQRVHIISFPGASPELRGTLYGIACARLGVDNVAIQTAS